MSELFVHSYEILNQSQSTDDETISQIEQLVRTTFPSISASQCERLVLDILMAHHHNKDPKEAYKTQKIVNSVSTPVQKKVQTQPKSTLPFDQLRTLLGEDNTDDEILRVLQHNDFHLGRVVDMLSGNEIEIELSKEQMAQRIMCRYFLSGNCIRGSQCMYSHDGKSRICRFWLHQKCVMGEQCIFMHDVPMELTHYEVPEPVKVSLNELPTLGQHTKLKQKPTQTKMVLVRRDLVKIKDVLGTSTDNAIQPPKQTPWVFKSDISTKFVDLRLQAAQLAETRNKLLLNSTNSWSLNDAARAKQLSDKGREAEKLMVQKYRQAADLLWDNQSVPGAELWVDLHGLDLIVAINFLEEKLDFIYRTQKHMPRIMYVISGRGHFKAKKYADQLTQYVLAMLDANGYKHRDFGVDTTFGRITGVDPWSRFRTHE